MIINLTPNKATVEQLNAGVVDISEEKRNRIVELLTFDDIPDRKIIAERII